MNAAILLLSFGEPREPTLESVRAYLERIFRANASLDGDLSVERAARRSRELALRRAPALLEDYVAIGGSPLNRQVEQQARALSRELGRRGYDAPVFVGMQFTEPTIERAVEAARAAGARRLVAVPLYPLCGRSTTVAALETAEHAALRSADPPQLDEISGWHRHPGYVELRADAIRRCAATAGLDLRDPDTRLVFSAHGTPIQYLQEGNGYLRYVHEWCETLADRLGVRGYVLGFQNHGNRGVPWTEPEIARAVEEIDARAVLVDAVSFIHEQSETLVELDLELRKVAESAGLAFHRVPVPHDDPRFMKVLADLVSPFLERRNPLEAGFRRCACRSTERTFCLNGPR